MSRGQTFAIEIGKEYGWLTVLSEAGRGKDGHLKYLVRCRCGKEYAVQRGFLRKPECKCVDCYRNLPHAAREPLNKPSDVINGSLDA